MPLLPRLAIRTGALLLLGENSVPHDEEFNQEDVATLDETGVQYGHLAASLVTICTVVDRLEKWDLAKVSVNVHLVFSKNHLPGSEVYCGQSCTCQSTSAATGKVL